MIAPDRIVALVGLAMALLLVGHTLMARRMERRTLIGMTVFWAAVFAFVAAAFGLAHLRPRKVNLHNIDYHSDGAGT